MNYKLGDGFIIRLTDNAALPLDPRNADYQNYLTWLALGNTPEPADQPTPEQLARQAEVIQAPLTARAYFAASPAAVAFIRLTPEQQATQISAMTQAQKDTLLKYLAVAVSALVKKEFLNGG